MAITAQRIETVKDYITNERLVDTGDKDAIETVAYHCSTDAIWSRWGTWEFDDFVRAIRNAYVDGYMQHCVDAKN